MANKLLTATIDPVTGEVELDLAGYKGKGCHALQDVFSKALGGETLTETRKPEFNAPLNAPRCVTR